MREEKVMGVRSTPYPGCNCYIWLHTRSPAILPPRRPHHPSGAKRSARSPPPVSHRRRPLAPRSDLACFGVLASDSGRIRVQKA